MARQEAGNVQPTAAPRPPQGGAGAARVVLALACAAQFMVVLDVSVVNVALPSIQRSLGFAAADLQWVAGAYALMFGGFLLLGGRLADLYGHKRVFLAGLTLFTAASLAGGLANTAGLLVAARALQGLGAAVLAPATLTILTVTFPEGTRRTRALAIWTAVGLAGGAAGNLLSGALTQYLTWRSTLLINVPIGAVAVSLAAVFLTSGRATTRTARLDVGGAVLVTFALLTLTYGVTTTQTRGWGDALTVAALAAGLAALAAFVVVEARVAPIPLISPRLFRTRAIWLGNAAIMLTGAAFQIPLWYFLTLYMQQVLHFGALQTGLGFLPHTVVMLTVGLCLTPWLMNRLSARTLIVGGALIAAAGFAWQSRITADSTYLTGVLGPGILLSVGGGLFNTPLTTTVTSGVPAHDAGAASGLMNTSKQIGGALGLAILIALTVRQDDSAHALAAGYGQAFAITAAALAGVAALAFALPRGR
ncbi:drug resistance transporter, EmrB/QacA subfamily [Streptosporangium canum]|uniref:Drug resistance transporter, EmrB/QacA subfamily n=1 Tax=Streptosporangium canum TaxID=324952 RepID=A0A1I3H102_9ACTN|nr:drug resistance transporter, EmrB/QacA subfamily [Streptosporangium canum]